MGEVIDHGMRILWIKTNNPTWLVAATFFGAINQDLCLAEERKRINESKKVCLA